MKSKNFIILPIFLFLFLLIGIAYLFAAGTVTQLRPVTVHDMGAPPMVGIDRPQWVDAIVLIPNTATSHTKPTGANYVLFSATSNFYVSYSGTAVVPSVNITDGTGCELNPVLRGITDVSTLSLISPNSCKVTMGFYK